MSEFYPTHMKIIPIYENLPVIFIDVKEMLLYNDLDFTGVF